MAQSFKMPILFGCATYQSHFPPLRFEMRRPTPTDMETSPGNRFCIVFAFDVLATSVLWLLSLTMRFLALRIEKSRHPLLPVTCDLIQSGSDLQRVECF